jgi:protein-disulfide isomerase
VSKAKRTGQRARGHERRGDRTRLLVALGGAGVFALAAFLFLRPSAGATVAPPVPYSSPVRGDANAPVTIVEYGDFQCPSCDAFFRAVEPRILSEYVKTGKAKLVFKNFPWIGDESRRAAEAAACAGAQGRFWEYHDVLYSSQRGENSGTFAVPNLKRFAAQLGLDQTAFDSCVDGRAYKAAVDADTNEVHSLGLTGTPTFVINGQRVVGAQDYSVFASVIERKLAGR